MAGEQVVDREEVPVRLNPVTEHVDEEPPASVLDLGALHVDRATVAFALLTDPLAARARAACAVVAAVPSAV